MKYKTTLFLFLFIYQSIAQDSLAIKPVAVSNPIVFTELYIGLASGSSNGILSGINLNYQNNDNLFTARFTNLANLKLANVLIIFPAFINYETINEYALLYGKRYIYNNHSFSYSAGISIINRTNLTDYKNNLNIYSHQNGFGFPFEVNIKWFKRVKKPYRIYYGLFAIGNKKVSFGQSIGFKLVGNISKTYFVGLGLNMGVGWHKKY